MKTIIRLLGLFIVCITSCLCIQCEKTFQAPMVISGVWATDNENYTGETVEIGNRKIIFSSDTRETFEYEIEEVKSEKGHLYNTTLYTIYYTDNSGEKNLVRLLYSPENGGTLMFKSEQNIDWKRL